MVYFCIFEVTNVHVPCSEVQQCGSALLRRKDVCGLTLQCWNVKVLMCYVLWPLEGSRRASQCDDTRLFPLVSNAVMDRKPTGRCMWCFIGCCHDCVKLLFLKQRCLKPVCMLKQKHKVHNTREDTLKALYYCNIVDV